MLHDAMIGLIVGVVLCVGFGITFAIIDRIMRPLNELKEVAASLKRIEQLTEGMAENVSGIKSDVASIWRVIPH